jgi:hypothetical protein
MVFSNLQVQTNLSAIKEDEYLLIRAVAKPKIGEQEEAPLTIKSIVTEPATNFRDWERDADGRYSYKLRSDAQIKSVEAVRVQGKEDDYITESIKLYTGSTKEEEKEVTKTIGQAQAKVVSKFPESSNYKLDIALWEDVDDNNIIDPQTDNLLKYENQNQTKTFRFTFNPNKPPNNCQQSKVSPQANIIMPRDRTIISNCSADITIQVAAWDDCMEAGGLRYARLYHTKIPTTETGYSVSTPQTTHNQGLYTFTVTKEDLQKAVNKIDEVTKKRPDRIKFVVQVEDNSEEPRHATDSVNLELKCKV